MIVGQFAGNSKAVVPATKNHNLCTAYNIDFVDSDGYESDFTHNSEGTFQFIANSSTMYDTTDNERNGENVSEEKGLNANAAALTRPKMRKGRRDQCQKQESKQRVCAAQLAQSRMRLSKDLRVTYQ